MRASEFISESRPGTRSKPHDHFERAHPGLIGPDANAGDIYWGRYYDHYRVSSLAGMDPDDIAKVDEISFFGNLPVFSAYTASSAFGEVNVPWFVKNSDDEVSRLAFYSFNF